MSLSPSSRDPGGARPSSLPTGRRGQALALALLALGLGIVWLLVGQPLVELHAEQGARLASRLTLAARMEERIAEAPPDGPDTTGANAIASYPSGLIEAESDALGAALLQDLVTTAASDAGLALSSVETLPAEDAGALRKIGLRLNLEGPYDALITMIGSLRQGSVALVLDDLEIHGGTGTAEGIGKDSTLSEGQAMRASFTIRGFRTPPPAAEAPGMPGSPS